MNEPLHYRLHLYEEGLLRDKQIIVLPTLIKSLPGPLRRLVGDLSDEDKVMLGLGLVLEDDSDDPA
jgi:hypothetical protein